MASGGWSGSTRRETLPPDWSRIRKRILRRDPICALCHERDAREVDHLGDRNDHRDANLRGVCSPCHQPRSARQGGAASGVRARARAQARKRPAEPHPGAF